MSYQQNHNANPWSIFLLLLLLMMGSPRSYEKRLSILSSAIDATSKSLRTLGSGMGNLQTGLQQMSLSFSPEPSETTLPGGGEDEQVTTPPKEDTDHTPVVAANLYLNY